MQRARFEQSCAAPAHGELALRRRQGRRAKQSAAIAGVVFTTFLAATASATEPHPVGDTCDERASACDTGANGGVHSCPFACVMRVILAAKHVSRLRGAHVGRAQCRGPPPKSRCALTERGCTHGCTTGAPTLCGDGAAVPNGRCHTQHRLARRGQDAVSRAAAVGSAAQACDVLSTQKRESLKAPPLPCAALRHRRLHDGRACTAPRRAYGRVRRRRQRCACARRAIHRWPALLTRCT